MTITTGAAGTTADLATARARNEATWRAAAVALYAGDIEEFLAHWTAEPRYSVAYPVDGIPPTVEGRDQFRSLFGGFGAATTRIEVHDVRFHQTDDPDVAFVEERMVADLVGGGTYENLLAIRVTFRDGLIADMYEYYGEVAHRAMVASLGGAQ
jgi:ketosteroid isomerase-like protein